MHSKQEPTTVIVQQSNTSETKGGQNQGTAAKEFKLGINTKKNDADFCTAIDILHERIITKGIKKHFPNYEITGEEVTGTGFF